jgi:hypothetical protein
MSRPLPQQPPPGSAKIAQLRETNGRKRKDKPIPFRLGSFTGTIYVTNKRVDGIEYKIWRPAYYPPDGRRMVRDCGSLERAQELLRTVPMGFSAASAILPNAERSPMRTKTCQDSDNQDLSKLASSLGHPFVGSGCFLGASVIAWVAPELGPHP